jgi:hypothetical protein
MRRAADPPRVVAGHQKSPPAANCIPDVRMSIRDSGGRFGRRAFVFCVRRIEMSTALMALSQQGSKYRMAGLRIAPQPAMPITT